jgi:hypothetical protein
MTKMFRIIRQVMLIRASVPAVHIVEIIEPISYTPSIPEKVKELKCSRCERTGHLPAFCIAKYDIGGHEIEDDYDGVGTGTHA